MDAKTYHWLLTVVERAARFQMETEWPDADQTYLWAEIRAALMEHQQEAPWEI